MPPFTVPFARSALYSPFDWFFLLLKLSLRVTVYLPQSPHLHSNSDLAQLLNGSPLGFCATSLRMVTLQLFTCLLRWLPHLAVSSSRTRCYIALFNVPALIPGTMPTYIFIRHLLNE